MSCFRIFNSIFFVVASSSDAAESVSKLRKVAKEHDATVVWGHDPISWKIWKKAPMFYYD